MAHGAANVLPACRPRLGFVGVGWVGLWRMKALLAEDIADIVAVSDPDPTAAHRAAEAAPDASILSAADDLLSAGLDAVVIASPSGLHHAHATQALSAGLAVFCQKPLALCEAEVSHLVSLARAEDRLLAVDFSYRWIPGLREARSLIRSGALGRVYAADLVFHNAYGPDKAWFYDPALSGGGCLMDLGVHLVDLALWLLDGPRVAQAGAALFAKGSRLSVPVATSLEDYAQLSLEMEGGAAVNIACSWGISAGCDAVIGATFYGTRGSVQLTNLDGSFYRFVVRHLTGTSGRELGASDGEWAGAAIVNWARCLARGAGFDPAVESAAAVAAVVDKAYGR
jgi:predicted dehydrogenase